MMSSCWQVSFYPQNAEIMKFEDFLENFFEVNACNYSDDGMDEYVGYSDNDFDEQKMLAFAEAMDVILPKYEISYLESQNWLKDYVIKFSPFEVEDFLIYGVHEETKPETTKIPLKIYAATAFGSDHPTTRACLKAISELYHNGYVAKNILDIGTGSGILSLASLKLWKESNVIATDIDEEAVWVTRQNAVDNNEQNSITCEVSDGYAAGIIAENAPYDLILSNILARPLIEMASSLSSSLKQGGYCILSGFVDEQVDWVVENHTKEGLKLVKLYEIDNWRAALMEKI